MSHPRASVPGVSDVEWVWHPLPQAPVVRLSRAADRLRATRRQLDALWTHPDPVALADRAAARAAAAASDVALARQFVDPSDPLLCWPTTSPVPAETQAVRDLLSFLRSQAEATGPPVTPAAARALSRIETELDDLTSALEHVPAPPAALLSRAAARLRLAAMNLEEGLTHPDPVVLADRAWWATALAAAASGDVARARQFTAPTDPLAVTSQFAVTAAAEEVRDLLSLLRWQAEATDSPPPPMVVQCLASTADTLDDIATVLGHVPAP